MSGHSKWATIKHQKEANDKARGAIFSKLSRAITIAIQEGNGETNPNANFKLRLAIERARDADMPKGNIERAIAKGAGVGEEKLETIQFEGYGPQGVGIIIEAITDKRQRTIQEIKNLFEKNGGSIASPGAVVYNFERKGKIIVLKNNSPEEQMLALMDIEKVNDLEEKAGEIQVITSVGSLGSVINKIKELHFQIKSSLVIMKPKVKILIKDKEKSIKINNFIKNLEDHDDIQAVFTNFEEH